MKKTISKLFLVIGLIMVFAFTNVTAREYYYTNDNGVSLTKEEYDFLSKFYWDGYQKYMTMDQYNDFIEKDLINSEFASKETIDVDFVTRGTEHTTSSKNLKISKGCSSSYCTVAITLTWLGNPSVRSWDVIGARFAGVSGLRNYYTSYYDSSTSFSASNYIIPGNGIGNSLDLANGSGIIINQTFEVNPGGTVYASYQHAVSNTTLAVSRDYTISSSGYGNVFLFGTAGRSIYDGMNGVSITL